MDTMDFNDIAKFKIINLIRHTHQGVGSRSKAPTSALSQALLVICNFSKMFMSVILSIFVHTIIQPLDNEERGCKTEGCV